MAGARGDVGGGAGDFGVEVSKILICGDELLLLACEDAWGIGSVFVSGKEGAVWDEVGAGFFGFERFGAEDGDVLVVVERAWLDVVADGVGGGAGGDLWFEFGGPGDFGLGVVWPC